LGVSAGLAALTFGGLELWAGAALVIAATLWASMRRLAAACDDANAACSALPSVSRRQVTVLLAVGTVLLALAVAPIVT